MTDSKTISGQSQKNQNDLVASYLQVRKFIGWIGISLPILLLVFSFGRGDGGPKDSISAYFYSGGREILVGSLFAIGVFLYAYKGYDKDLRRPTDKLVSRLAAIGAVGIAFSPMGWEAAGLLEKPDDTWVQAIFPSASATLHGLFAVLFFASIATFCLINFCRCEEGSEPDGEKLFRNLIFRTLGVIIILCTIGFVAGSLLDIKGPLVFWAEAIAVWAFGLSWIIKGKAIEGTINRVRSLRTQK